ncbi:signal recognition particle-docking protein FtsY [Chelativorans sp. YIM 93263]|uniref:signal recognition particle-docking protein FtsY n=1 Tax=Chelativorans sp. YIM 93263 TaxID=2906648 RepID=UPI002379B30E|nr:signal recognition particle-docking protein FtsY [Chelativorans sp. YIM 93263]
MAFGFIKKVFSFGKKEVEERTPEEESESTAEPVAEPAESPTPAEPAPAPEPEPAPKPGKPEPEIPGEPGPDVPEPPTEVPKQEPDRSPEPVPEIPKEPEPAPTPPRSPDVDPLEKAPGHIPDAETPEQQVEPEEPRSQEAREQDEAPAPTEPQGRTAVSETIEPKAEEVPAPVQPESRKPWFQRLREGLSRSSRDLRDNITGIFLKRKLDEDTLQDLEDVLLRADLGLETAMRVTDALATGRFGKDVSGAEVQAVMAEEIEKVLAPVAKPLELDLSYKPHVILVVGVNGTGKTTTIGKLAAKLSQGGLKVTLAAGDTFRAAAIEQLKIWAERVGAPVVSSKLGADAAGLAYDAYEKAKASGSDVLIIDTAGRLQNKSELMAELEKVVRVLGKHDPEAPHTILQTLDATTGQNALNQVEIFRNVAGVNGLVMTKLDGTARGGILVSIAAKHKLPIYFIGIGEQVEDLEPFSASDFAKAIAGVTE